MPVLLRVMNLPEQCRLFLPLFPYGGRMISKEKAERLRTGQTIDGSLL